MKHTKRYILTVQEWGVKIVSYVDDTRKSFFNSTDTEFDTIEEADAWIKDVEEYYKISNIERPDVNSNKKYEKIVAKEGAFPEIYYTEETYVYDENHFWWGYAVLDYKNEKVIMQGGVGLYDFWNPMKSLAILDRYFRKEGEVPKDYVWDINEYEGWLRFRWGDGENAIDKVKTRRAKEDELKKKAKKQEEQEDWADFEYDEEYDMYRFKD